MSLTPQLGPRGRRTLVTWLLAAFAPRSCAGCGAVGDRVLCSGCLRRLDELARPGDRLDRHGLISAAYPFEEPVRTALHRAKYSAEPSAAGWLGELAAGRLVAGPRAAVDLVVPVPLGRRRRRQRGFNQAELIAAALAGSAGLPLTLELRRVRDTPPQVGRDEELRQRNVEGCFEWVGPDLGGASLWLVDDVVTTGSTARAAAAALRRAGAGSVHVAAVAAAI